MKPGNVLVQFRNMIRNGQWLGTTGSSFETFTLTNTSSILLYCNKVRRCPSITCNKKASMVSRSFNNVSAVTSNRAALLIYDDENTEDKPVSPKGRESECVFSGGSSPLSCCPTSLPVSHSSSFWLPSLALGFEIRKGLVKLAQMVLLFFSSDQWYVQEDWSPRGLINVEMCQLWNQLKGAITNDSILDTTEISSNPWPSQFLTQFKQFRIVFRLLYAIA